MIVELIKQKKPLHSVGLRIKRSEQIRLEGRNVYIGGYVAEHETEEAAARLHEVLMTALALSKFKKDQVLKFPDTGRTYRAALSGKYL